MIYLFCMSLVILAIGQILLYRKVSILYNEIQTADKIMDNLNVSILASIHKMNRIFETQSHRLQLQKHEIDELIIDMSKEIIKQVK